MIGKETMDRLQALAGKSVTVEYVHYGSVHEEKDKVVGVLPFSALELKGQCIPFIGYGCAIRKVVHEGEIVYWNDLIPVNYDVRNDERQDILVGLMFGREVEKEKIRQRKEYEADFKRRQAARDQAARDMSPALVDIGGCLVKPGFRDEWVAWAKNNTQDGYSCAVVQGVVRAMTILQAGGELKTAEKAACESGEDGLTGFQLGCVAQTLAHFDPRGEEFRAYWNRQYMSEEKAAEAKGVVNPAILHVAVESKE